MKGEGGVSKITKVTKIKGEGGKVEIWYFLQGHQNEGERVWA